MRRIKARPPALATQEPGTFARPPLPQGAVVAPLRGGQHVQGGGSEESSLTGETPSVWGVPPGITDAVDAVALRAARTEEAGRPGWTHLDLAATTVSSVTAETFCMAFLALRGQSAQADATGRVGWMHLDLAQCTPSCVVHRPGRECGRSQMPRAA